MMEVTSCKVLAIGDLVYLAKHTVTVPVTTKYIERKHTVILLYKVRMEVLAIGSFLPSTQLRPTR